MRASSAWTVKTAQKRLPPINCTLHWEGADGGGSHKQPREEPASEPPLHRAESSDAEPASGCAPPDPAAQRANLGRKKAKEAAAHT